MGETVKGGLDVLKTRIEELECELDRVTKKYARLIQLINLCPHAFYAIDYDGRFLFQSNRRKISRCGTQGHRWAQLRRGAWCRGGGAHS